MQLTRRALLATVIGVPMTGRTVTASGVHLIGTLTATETEATEGYFNFCSGEGVCHATDALMITAHPQSPMYTSLTALVGRTVQISIFEP